jgi:hypothetical protein
MSGYHLWQVLAWVSRMRTGHLWQEWMQLLHCCCQMLVRLASQQQGQGWLPSQSPLLQPQLPWLQQLASWQGRTDPTLLMQGLGQEQALLVLQLALKLPQALM